MINHLKTMLTAAGCSMVVFESDQLANIVADQSHPADTIGMIIEPNNVTFETAGNGVNDHFPPVYVEIMKQITPESSAESRADIMDGLRQTAKTFIFNCIHSGNYKKIKPVVATKINERKYDANVIGWSLAMDLQPIVNKLNC